MTTAHNIQLTSAEISSLWTSYMNDSMAYCVIKHFRKNNEDTEIQSILDSALNLSQLHIQQIAEILEQDNHSVPKGFNDEDLRIEAPKLYFDYFYLIYIQNMAKMGMKGYSMMLSYSSHPDILKYYTDCLTTSIELYNKTNEILASKGILTRAPYCIVKHKVEFIKNEKDFFSGIFNTKKILLSLDVAELFNNIQRNLLGEALLLGFSQVAESKEIREYMVRGKEITKKHITIFTTLLSQNDLPTLMTSDYLPTESKISPFSDKLMMFHITSLIVIGIAYYGQSLSTSIRKDLQVDYIRLMAEIGDYAKDGAKLMIKNGWLEQSPKSADRDELAE
jgi:hypothetical protein